MLPEPLVFKERTAETIYNIHQGIELKQCLYMIGKHIDIPHDGSRPHTYLKRNINDLLQIPDENHQGTGQIT